LAPPAASRAPLRLALGAPRLAALVAGTAGGRGGFGSGWTKLGGTTYRTQVGWLYPLAGLALVFGLVWTAGPAGPTKSGPAS
ncbi:MAG: hypothetical protein WAK82_42400, partial [Streptosporangiaceae bacterium]